MSMLIDRIAVAEWVRTLAWNGDRTFLAGFEPHFGKNVSLRNFGNSVYPSLPVSFGWDTKSHLSLLSGVYARESKRSHQSALECVTVVDSTSHSKPPEVCLCGWKRCPALKKKKKKYWCVPLNYPSSQMHCTVWMLCNNKIIIINTNFWNSLQVRIIFN